MVGQGVLRECLLADDVERVISVVRKPTGAVDPKLRELVHSNFFDLAPVEPDLAGADACFFCAGVSSAGMSETEYARVTYEMTISVATALHRLGVATFTYVSGAGTDSSEKGRVMWARVKGRTENAVLRMGFARAGIFRPAAIVPMHGIRSRTALYQIFYDLLGPVMPMLHRNFPRYVTTTERVGRAMLAFARTGQPRATFENIAIDQLGCSKPRPASIRDQTPVS